MSAYQTHQQAEVYVTALLGSSWLKNGINYYWGKNKTDSLSQDSKMGKLEQCTVTFHLALFSHEQLGKGKISSWKTRSSKSLGHKSWSIVKGF